MKKMILFLVLVLAATILFSQEQLENRGFYFGFGGGPAKVVYPEPLDSLLNSIEDSGVDRITLEIDLTLGGALNDKTYLVGAVSGYGDRLEDATYWVQLTTVFYAAGVRFYPFTTGLVFGGDLGRTRMVLSAKDAVDEESDYGLGYDFIIAYDFDRTKTGFAFQLGLRFGVFDIEDEKVTGVSLFGNLVWK